METVKKVYPNDMDEELFGQLAAIFRRVTPDRVQKLEAAIQQKQWEAAGRIAHTIKSSAAQLGLTDLSTVCKEMEGRWIEGATAETEGERLFASFQRQMGESLAGLP